MAKKPADSLTLEAIAAQNLVALMPMLANRVEREGHWPVMAAAKLAVLAAKCLVEELERQS